MSDTHSTITLPVVPELPPVTEKLVNSIRQRDWDEQDWQDLYRAISIIRYNVAVRHGLLARAEASV